MKLLRLLAFVLIAFHQAVAADDPFAQSETLLNAAAQHHADSAARPKTLPELQEMAMHANPQIRIAVRRVSVAEARQPGAGALDDPMFMYRDWGTPLKQPWNLNQAQNMFMYTQVLPGPGKRALRSEIAGKGIEAAKVELEAVQRDVSVRVSRAFYDLLRNRDEMRIHDEQFAIARQALETARIKYTVGSVMQADVLKAQVSITRLVEHLNMLAEDGELARATLNSLIGRDPAEPLSIIGEYGVPSRLPTLTELESIALEHRPELAMYSKLIEQSEAKTKLAQKGYMPDYTVSGGYMLMPTGSTYRNTYMAEFSLNLPWLNRRKHDAEVSEAQAITLEERAEHDNQQAMVFLEIQEALIKAQTVYRNLLLYRDTLQPQAEATLKATAAAYKNDRTDFMNVLDAQNVTLDVQSSYFKNAAEFESRLADLERAVGAPIPRDSNPPVEAPEVQQ
jgi:outer membrane protein TolC